MSGLYSPAINNLKGISLVRVQLAERNIAEYSAFMFIKSQLINGLSVTQ